LTRINKTSEHFQKTVQHCVLLVGFGLMQMWSPSASALTGADTVINNTATASYLISGIPATQNASVAFTVQEIIDVTVAWTDGLRFAYKR
jgi:hypothetical protein